MAIAHFWVAQPLLLVERVFMNTLESLRQSVQLSPKNVPLLHLFGIALLDAFETDEAIATFHRALMIDPAHHGCRLGLIRGLSQAGQLSEAIVRLEAFLQDLPNEAEAHLLMSRLLATEGNLEAAKESYAHAAKLPGFSPDAALEKQLFFEKPTSSSSSGQPRIAATALGWEERRSQEADADEADPPEPTPEELERPAIAFADIGGMEQVKEEIRMKILYPLQNPELFRAYGKRIGGGVLLYGPPGCGKTMLSRATAGEIKAHFLAVGLHQILDLYIGESEKNLHRLFELARDHAPSVLFFDEVDALAADRNDMRRSAGRTLINQFLAEMDGQVSSNEGLLILGATNAPWHIDPAFRRPGRFDRVLFVPPPDEQAREAIIKVMARDKPIERLDSAALAKSCKDFSGADLKAVFDLTIERTLSQALKKGHVLPMTTNDLLKSAKQVKPSTKAWFESAKNYALYSNQGGFYDDVLSYLGINKS